MAFTARWIRSAPVGPYELHAACAGLALAQSARAAPVVFWARANARVLSEPCDIEENHFVLALIVPFRLAPGRRSRWRAWALAPALSVYRHFGVHAYLDDGAICLNGRRIAACGAQVIGECALLALSVLPRPPGALAEWAERDLEGALRDRIEVQHGWQFESSWPSATERATIAEVLAGQAANAQ